MSIKVDISDAEYMHGYVKQLAELSRSPGSPGEKGFHLPVQPVCGKACREYRPGYWCSGGRTGIQS